MFQSVLHYDHWKRFTYINELMYANIIINIDQVQEHFMKFKKLSRIDD